MLLRPLWLLALVAVAALAVLAWRRQHAGAWAAILAPEVMARLRRMGAIDGRPARWQRMMPFVAAAAVVLALSGPARLRPGAEAFSAADPLILLMDLSPSVTRSGRLGDAQAAAALVLQTAVRPVGIVVFAADAYLASAPTSDAMSLQGTVAVLGDGVMPNLGSRPDVALATVAGLFPDADVILISDGGGIGPHATEEALRLRQRGLRLWALPLDAPGPEGAPPTDPAALTALARAGGGEAFAAPRALIERIESARISRLVRGDRSALVVQDFGRWCLLAAVIPMLLMFRRGQ